MTTPSDGSLTPIQQAVEEKQFEREHPEVVAEEEADELLDDIEEYVAETDPARLAEAQEQLDDWTPPAGDAPDVVGDALAPVCGAATEAEAVLIKGVLEAAGIPAAVVGGIANPYSAPLVVGEGGWGGVYVAPDRVEEAKAALAAAEADAGSAAAGETA